MAVLRGTLRGVFRRWRRVRVRLRDTSTWMRDHCVREWLTAAVFGHPHRHAVGASRPVGEPRRYDEGRGCADLGTTMIMPTSALCRPRRDCACGIRNPACRGRHNGVELDDCLLPIDGEKETSMVKSASRVSRVLMTGPLASFADSYALALEQRRYTPLTSVVQLRQVARLSSWLEVRGLGVAELTGERVEEFLAFQRATGRWRAQRSRPGLLCLLDVLQRLGVRAVEEPVQAGSPGDALLASFERYLLTERGLAAGTARGYVRHAARFLAGLSPRGLADVTAADVAGAGRGESTAVSVSATQYFVAGLRALLRFCVVEGLMHVDLSQAALPVTGRRRSALPRGITAAEARALLESCDRRSALGRRDYALIITLLRLGLRRSEVATLRLDDIDWRAAELVVVGKGARQDRLPLPADVGEAIASYLRRGRPISGRREVFLRARAPFDPIAPGTVASTVRRACRRAGVAEVGSHRLRHTVACEMVSAGVPLAQIAQVLRHHSLQTTAAYARVDLDRLRLVSAPWPAGAQR